MMDPSNVVVAALARIWALVDEALEVSSIRHQDLPVDRMTLYHLRKGRDVRLSTVVKIADACGFDVVINFRQRAPARDVQKRMDQ
jgi:hypothetical protein